MNALVGNCNEARQIPVVQFSNPGLKYGMAGSSSRLPIGALGIEFNEQG
jgi:hypothetical protein